MRMSSLAMKSHKCTSSHSREHRLMQHLVPGLISSLCGICPVQAQQTQVDLINVQPNSAVTLVQALRKQGLSPSAQDAVSPSFSGALVVLEVGGALSPETVDGLKNFIRHGGALLIGLDRDPGIAPAQLAFLSPTMAWTTQARTLGARPLVFSAIETAASDPDLFGKNHPSFTLPYYFPIRPISAVERGIARYDRYLVHMKSDPFDHGVGSFYWTRPLLNRDWRVRLRGNDRASSPLLITGRYGAGRVAVFASSLTGEGAPREAFWQSVITWLTAASASSGNEPRPGAIDLSAKAVLSANTAGVLRVSLKNHPLNRSLCR